MRKCCGSGWVGIVLSSLLFLGACGKRGNIAPDSISPETLKVISPVLEDGRPIPAAYACRDGADLGKSPPIAWSKGPPGTTHYAVSVVDPDAKNFVHWFVSGIPANVTELPEGASPGGSLPRGVVELPNDFGKAGYGGPCPPPGALHHYIVEVWALKSPVKAQKANAELFHSLIRKAVATGSITVTYRR